MSSHEFDDVFCTMNSFRVLCDCGKTHFTRRAEDVDELRDKASIKRSYTEHTDDAIGWGVIDGRQYVYQCPCGRLDRIEKFIWDYQEEICEYLKRRLAKERDELKQRTAQLDQITT